MNDRILRLEIPMKPVSVNSMYMTRGRFRVLTTEARNFKTFTEDLVKNFLTAEHVERLDRCQALRVVITLVSPIWFTKSNTIRKRDAESYSKCTNDAVFSALPVDDSKIFDLQIKKKVGDCEMVIFEIFETTFDEFQ